MCLLIRTLKGRSRAICLGVTSLFDVFFPLFSVCVCVCVCVRACVRACVRSYVRACVYIFINHLRVAPHSHPVFFPGIYFILILRVKVQSLFQWFLCRRCPQVSYNVIIIVIHGLLFE